MKAIKVQWIMRQALGLVCGSLLACVIAVAQQSGPTEQAPEQLLSTEQLNTLVAPVALYPDALLSQVLVAATYPLEIVEVGQWLKRNSDLQGSKLVDAAREQKWDPSIQALVVFPDVIKRLNADIRWTTDLGDAFLSQQADVMNAVQRMRAQAMAAGKLQSTAQDTVTTEKQGDRSVIQIQPANPEVVYVPHYDPAYIWGPPLYGYYPAWDYPYVGFGFGPGIYIGRSFGGLYWGGWGWGPNWYQCSIYQNRYFFNHYGYGGHGYRYGAAWAHDPGHRQRVRYPNSALNQRYGGVLTARGGSGFSRFGGQSYASRQYNAAPQANAAQASSSRRFSQSGFASQGAQRSYSSTSAYDRSSGYRTSPSYSRSYGGNRSAYSDRFSPSYGGSSGYRTSPSYSRSYGGDRSVYSNRFSPSNVSSGYRASPSYSGGYGGNPSVRSYPSIPSSDRSGYRMSPSYGGNRSVPSYRSGPSFAGRGGVQSTHSFGGGGSIRSGGGSRGGRGR